MTTKRSLERRIEALDVEHGQQPGVVVFMTPFSLDDPLPGAFTAVHEVRNPFGGASVIVDGEDVTAFRDRLDDTLRTVEPAISQESYCAYLDGRRDGSIPAGREAIREHFGDSVDVNRVFCELVEAGPMIIHNDDET